MPNVTLMPARQEPKRPRTRSDFGTAVMLAGTAVSAASVLIYQLVAGRSLGTDGFAPIAVLWALMFVIYTVLMIPIEQFITRRLVVAGGRRGWLGSDRGVVVAILGSGWVLGMVFVVATLDTFFAGESVFVVITAILLGSRAVLAVGRGMLAGRRRFVAYGGSLAAEALTLMALGLVAASLSPTTVAFSWALVVGPLTVLAFRPWQTLDESPVDEEPAGEAVKFLGWLIVATAASQVVIAAGPILVGLIGGTAASVSIVFVTFTLFRGPVTSAYNLVARVLPDFTELSMSGGQSLLTRWRHRIAIGGTVLAFVGAVAAYFVGPWIVEFLYGSEFGPPRIVAALGGSAVGAGLGALFVGQIFIASGRTRGLALGWVASLAIAAVVVVVIPLDPMHKVAWAFAVGEFSALIILGFGPRVSTRSSA